MLCSVRNSTAYLSKLSAKFNEKNLQLQGNEVNLLRPNPSSLRLFKVNSIQVQYRQSRAIPISEPVCAKR
jgi:hypothetical protein